MRADAVSVQQGLRQVDRSLADKGLAAPLLAFAFSFTILFREGLEAVLLVAILLGSLKAGRATNYRRPLIGGIAAAIVASVATWLLATFVIEIAPFQRELIEGATAFAAVVVLFAITFWLVARLEHRHWMEFMRARVSAAIAAGTGLAFAGLGFTAVYREGFETVLFYQALALFAEGLALWIALGAVAAAIALVVVGYAILKLGKRLPLKPMLLTAAMLLLALSVAFVGNAVRSLQEGDWIGVTPVSGDWARLPDLPRRADRHPSDEGRAPHAGGAAERVRRSARCSCSSFAQHCAAAWRGRPGVSHGLRIGVDVGGTFTKAVAVSSQPLTIHAHASVPTTHAAGAGVAEGVAAALRELLGQLGDERSRVQLVAFSTTQAMNALLEGDVGTVGVVGIGYRPELRVARKRTRVGEIALAPGRKLATEHAFIDASDGFVGQRHRATSSATSQVGAPRRSP